MHKKNGLFFGSDCYQDDPGRPNQLGLLAAGERLSDFVALAVENDLSTYRLLDDLLSSDLNCRDERRHQSSLRLSGPTPGQSLRNFDFAFQPNILVTGNPRKGIRPQQRKDF